MEDLKNELSKVRTALVRTQDELINYQQISKKDVENAKNFAIANFSRDMLAVYDALNGALQRFENKV